MKHLLLSASLLLGTALLSAYAEDAAETGDGGQKAHTQESVHPPTNRVGEAVPTMKSDKEPAQTESKTVTPSEQTGDAAEGAQKGQESIHPPTSRIGTAVPTMKDDKKSGSTTE